MFTRLFYIHSPDANLLVAIHNFICECVMKPEHFFEVPTRDDPFDEDEATTAVLNEALLHQLCAGPIPDGPDHIVATALIKLIHHEYEAYSTGYHQTITLEQSALVLKAARLVIQRIGLEFPTLPFRDFDEFYRYWKREGMSGSYAARRDYLDLVFKDLEDALYEIEERQFHDALARALSPSTFLGWPEVEAEINQLRQRFTVAQTSQDYSAIGTACVRVLIALGTVTYDPTKHLRSGETEPPSDKTKQRLTRVIEDALPGEDNTEMRKLVSGAVEVAHKVKHRTTPTRRDAGIAADSVILLTHLIKRITGH